MAERFGQTRRLVVCPFLRIVGTIALGCAVGALAKMAGMWSAADAGAKLAVLGVFLGGLVGGGALIGLAAVIERLNDVALVQKTILSMAESSYGPGGDAPG